MATIEEAKASIQRRRSITTQGQGIWAVEERTSAKLVGNLLCKPVGITHQDGSAIIEIGWHLHPSAQGNGYATEAAEAVIDYAQSCGVDTISAFVDPLNIASVKVCERLGMTLQVLPKHVYGQQMLHFQVMKKSPKLQDNY